jgi:tight adherence protein B
VFSVGAALVAFLIPRIVVGKKAARRAAAFEGQLAETLDLFVGSLRAGQGLLQAIESSSYEQPEPMRSELRRIVGQVSMGVSITDAMESLTTRFKSRDVDLLAAAIAINRETGGNLTEVLERLAKTVRQRREVRAEAKSLTAAPRATGYILVILPFLLTGYSVAMSPIYREQLLHTQIGRLLLIGAIVWSFIGFLISQKLAKAEY